MSAYLPESMIDIAKDLYVPMVIREHGERAGEPLRELLDFINKLYQRIAPEILSGRLIIFKTIEDSARPISDPPLIMSFSGALHDHVHAPCVIQLLTNGSWLVWKDVTPNPSDIAQEAIVYTYQDRVEHFYAKGSSSAVKKTMTSLSSAFAVPTFDALSEALEDYQQTMIRHSSCDRFQKAWFDPKRLYFGPAPEEAMRDSLTYFLKNRLRPDIEVRPEQIVDDSHPVDIKVTWWMTNRLALIEIKWLGDSRNADNITASYRDKRARDGAKQLADYLDSNRSQSPLQTTRGYLVIIDGRRARLKLTHQTISHRFGNSFADKEIEFSPKYDETRKDFERPRRMFAEPVTD